MNDRPRRPSPAVRAVALVTALFFLPNAAPADEAAAPPGVVDGGAEAAERSAAASEPGAKTRGSTIVPLPFFLHTPETKSGGGVILTYFHRAADAAPGSPPSTYRTVFMITQRKQLVVEGAVERYWNADRSHLEGSASYARFPDTFYGTGNDTHDDVSEDYTPRTVAVSLGLRREVAPDVRVGPRAAYVHQDLIETEAGGLLGTGALPGSDGGTIVQLGASITRDRRDSTIYPRAGTYAELGFDAAHDALGSDFDFTTSSADARWYRSLSRHQVFAVRGVATVMTGTPPFQVLASLGGDTVMRGFYSGRFRERARWVLQGEYRLGFWKRLGLAAFAAAGDVAHDVTDFRIEEARASGGLGLRFLFSRAEEVTLRADFARGDDGTGGLYLSLLEAY